MPRMATSPPTATASAPAPGLACRVRVCRRPASTRGLCRNHYKQWHRSGRPDRPGERCVVAGCDRQRSERGWCHGHYQRWLRHGDVQADRPLRRSGTRRCTVDGCERTAVAQLLCRTHYARRRTTGDVAAARPIRRAEGNGSLSHGYWKVAVPPELRHLTGGVAHVAEHRLVMAVHLGRPLYPDETVHHRNGDRLDNLELWSTLQPAGQRVVDKVAWALEILRRYAPRSLEGLSQCNEVPPTGFEPALPP